MPAELGDELPLGTPERESPKQKWMLVQNIQKEHRSGKSLSRIARENQLDRRTVRKYVDLKNPPSIKRQRKHAVHAYEEEITALEQQGNTVKSIYRIIQASGYTGTFSGVRTSVESIHRHISYRLLPPL